MTLILVVEDDEMNRDMIAQRLKWEGYQVITAADGAAAVALAQMEPVRLVLMDMGLPIMGGWQAAQQLKADLATQAIPIIALTAYAMAEDKARAINAGCDEFETKPVNFSRLLAKIERFLADAPNTSWYQEVER